MFQNEDISRGLKMGEESFEAALKRAREDSKLKDTFFSASIINSAEREARAAIESFVAQIGALKAATPSREQITAAADQFKEHAKEQSGPVKFLLIAYNFGFVNGFKMMSKDVKLRDEGDKVLKARMDR